MKPKLFFIILLLLPTHLHGQYQIPASVFGNGGGVVSNSTFQMSSTVGQTLTGQVQAGNFRKYVGFWYQPDYIISVEELPNPIPLEYKLEQNYPNPFNPSTTIRFAVKERSKVELVIFNLLGESIATLVNEELDAGWYEAHFSAPATGGLASGVYVYRIIANQFVQSHKMLLLK